MKKIIIYSIMILILCSIVVATSGTKLLMHMDGDESFGHPITNGDVSHVTSTSAIGSSSMYFDGDDYLNIKDSKEFDLQDENFTIDFWYNTNYNHNQFVIYPNGPFYLLQTTGNPCNLDRGLNFYITDDNDGNQAYICFQAPIGWFHFAVERAGDTAKVYVNGNVIGTFNSLGNLINQEGDIKLLSDNGAYGANAYLDQFRFTKGISRMDDPNDQLYDPERDGFSVGSMTAYTPDEHDVVLIQSDTFNGDTYVRDRSFYGGKDVTINGNPKLQEGRSYNGPVLLSGIGGCVRCSATLYGDAIIPIKATRTTMNLVEGGNNCGGQQCRPVVDLTLSGSNDNESWNILLEDVDPSAGVFYDFSNDQEYRFYQYNFTPTGFYALGDVNMYESNSTRESAMSFDGNDYLTISNSADFNFGNNPFTIDFWLYAEDTDTYSALFDKSYYTAGQLGNYRINFVTSGTSRSISIHTADGEGNGEAISSGDVIDLGKWNHIGIVRFGTGTDQTKIYVNGVLANQGTISKSLGQNSADLMMGYGQGYLTGYSYLNAIIDNFRMINGVAINFSEVGVPTTSYSADENTTLLLHFNGDESFFNYPITFNGNANISSSNYKFNSSYYFDGNGDYLSIPGSDDFEFDADFTVDFWMYTGKNDHTDNDVIDFGTDLSTDSRIMFWPTNKLYWFDNNDTDCSLADSDSQETNSWTHYAFSREGSDFYMFKDGVQVAHKSNCNSVQGSSGVMTIGRRSDGATHYTGYLDELRISKGVARWTSEFTPPLRPYGQPVISSFSDGSTNISLIDDISYVENLTLSNEGSSIKWNSWVNLDGADLDSNVKMGSNFVSVNAAELDSSLNSSANVTLDVDHCNELTLYYAPEFYDNSEDIISNGQLCNYATSPACTNIVCNDGVVTFTAQHFDSYTGSSGAPVPEFSDYALVLAIALTIGGLFFIRKK